MKLLLVLMLALTPALSNAATTATTVDTINATKAEKAATTTHKQKTKKTNAVKTTQSSAETTSTANVDSSSNYFHSNGIIFNGRIGPSASSMSYTNDDKAQGNQSRTGLYVAAEFEIPVQHNLSFLTGLDFIQKGMDLDYTDPANGNNTQGTLSVNYLLIPMMAKYNVPFKHVGTLALTAGPYVAFAVDRNTSSETRDPVGRLLDQKSQTVNSDVLVYDLGARVGTTVEVPVTRDFTLLIGGNYDFGFTNINIAQDSEGSVTLKTGSLVASAGLAVRL